VNVWSYPWRLVDAAIEELRSAQRDQSRG